MEENNDNPTNKELFNHGKTDLLDNIVLLKAYVSLLENMIQNPKHNRLQLAKEPSRPLHNGEAATFHDIPHVQTKLFHDFYELVGIRCVKFERKSSFVFEMCSNESVTENNYMVEILIDDDGRGLLGNSKLPVTVYVEEILSQYPIEDISNVKHFLNCCKHYVDTYVCRVEQFTDLENLLSEIADAEVNHNYNFTLITITIPGIKDKITQQVYNVMLDLYYEPDGIRPCKLSSACEEVASSCLLKRLNKFFKPFLREKLCSALLQMNIFNTEEKFHWQKIMVNDKDIGIESYAYESTELLRGILKPYLYRKDAKEEQK